MTDKADTLELLKQERGCLIYGAGENVVLQPVFEKANGFSTRGLVGYRVKACHAVVWHQIIIPNLDTIGNDAIVREVELVAFLQIRGWNVTFIEGETRTIGWGKFHREDYLLTLD